MLPKLQPSKEDPYKVITQINHVVCRIQQHLDRLAPYLWAIRTSILEEEAVSWKLNTGMDHVIWHVHTSRNVWTECESSQLMLMANAA
jgi:hypothetical protein